jgi:hypothetical protein
MQHASAVERKDDEDIQHPKRDGCHREKFYRR